jgi:hypothetical protein
VINTQLGLADAAERLTTGGGPLIGRRAGQILARRELAKVSFWQRILHDLDRLYTASRNAIPGGWFGLIVLGVLVAALIAAVLTWARPTPHRRRRAHPLIGEKPRTALDYRRSATRLAEAGDYGRAIVDGVRAVAAELDERGILPPRPGRTAHELAVEASSAMPLLGDELYEAARLFDDVRYGDRPGTQAGYLLVTRVDANVRTAQVTVTDHQSRVGAGLRVPR